MRRIKWALLFLFATILVKAQSADALKVTQITLSNGLTVWLNEDHSQPKVFGAVVVKAGSRDCPNTGIAHYFEHIMFKGTDKIGTVNYKAEKVWLDSIATQYEILSKTKDKIQRYQIQKRINGLSLHAAEYAIPNEFPHLISKYGGSGLNAGTSYDYTQFYNTFSPQYITQWAELNSERLLHPVFRLFQGELETVYEEKNMYADNMIATPLEIAAKAFFGNSPYAYPIIGSTENLKNPRLNEMEAFYRKYYVASNMGLILCGDFDAESVVPLLEKTFGRLVKGTVPDRNMPALTPLNSRETLKIKIPIPIVKAEVIAFRGPTKKDADRPALRLAVLLLSNENETGYLDSLGTSHKILGAQAILEGLNEASGIGVGFIPNIPFGSVSKAEKLIWSQIERIKKGDFSQELLNALKLESLRNTMNNLENIDNRAGKMVEVFSEGLTWDDYLEKAASISSVTKEDIVRVANKYFTAEYLKLRKKFGSYPKDKIQKPDYKPVKSRNTDAASEYAKRLEQVPIQHISPRLLDFNKDVQTQQLTPHATLYVAKNSVNDLFSLSLIYYKGTLSDPRIAAISNYVRTIGTDSLTKQEFGKALQKLGTTFETNATDNTFTLTLSGFDRNLTPSLRLLRHFMDKPKADKKSMSSLISTYKVNYKSFNKNNEAIADAMFNKVVYGNKSEDLTHLTLDELRRMKDDDLLTLFKELINTECAVVYSGGLSASEVRQAVRNNLPIDRATIATTNVHRTMQSYSKPLVYFYNLPNARQCIIKTYQSLSPCHTDEAKARLSLWGSYFGRGFSSLLFQEIREFRAYAYYAMGSCLFPALRYTNEQTAYTTSLSTQSDKTMLALSTLDSLFTQMPIREKNFQTVKQEMINRINNNYPSFREIGNIIAQEKRNGYNEDSNTNLLKILPSLTMNDIISYYKDNVASTPRIIMVVGNKKNLPLQILSKYGKVIELKKQDIYR